MTETAVKRFEAGRNTWALRFVIPKIICMLGDRLASAQRAAPSVSLSLRGRRPGPKAGPWNGRMRG